MIDIFEHAREIPILADILRMPLMKRFTSRSVFGPNKEERRNLPEVRAGECGRDGQKNKTKQTPDL